MLVLSSSPPTCSLTLRHASPHLSRRGPDGAISGWVCGGKERGLVIMESHYWLVRLSLLTYQTVCRLPSLRNKNNTQRKYITQRLSFHLTLRVRRSSNHKASRDSSNPSFVCLWKATVFVCLQNLESPFSLDPCSLNAPVSGPMIRSNVRK